MSDSGPEGEPQGQKPNWLQRIFLRFGGKRQGDTVIATIGQSNRNIVVGKNIINIGKLNVSVWHLSALIVIILVGTVTLIYFNRRTNSTAGEILTLLQSPTATLTPSVTPTPTISPTPSPTATTTPTPLPKMNSGRVRVAVTAIGYQDENGVVTPLSNRDVGNNLGEALKTAMEDEKRRNFTNVSSDYFNVGWYPSEVIVGDSEAVREQNAAKLAQLVYANLVVYGYVEPKNNQWQLHLYFYYFDPEIREEPDAVSSGQLLGEAMVMLANPTTQPDRAIGDISDELNLRARALTWLAVGLYDDSIRKWEEAREIFRLGQEKLSAPQIGSKRLADDPNIQAIFHYFIGRESLWLRDYDNAISEQEMAIAANPNYANAYHALGVIYFDRAQVFFSQISSAQEAEQCAQGADRAQAANDDDDAWNYTVKAQAELSKTLDLAAVDEASAANGTPAEGEAPNWSHVASVAHLSLGLVQQLQAQVYFRDGELGDVEASLNAAKSEFEEALTGFSVEPPRTSYIGWSHFGLGLYYSIRADLADQGVSTDGQTPTELLQGAVKEYQACIDRQVADSNSFFNQKVINCGCKAYLSEAEEKLQQVAPPAMTPAESSP